MVKKGPNGKKGENDRKRQTNDENDEEFRCTQLISNKILTQKLFYIELSLLIAENPKIDGSTQKKTLSTQNPKNPKTQPCAIRTSPVHVHE